MGHSSKVNARRMEAQEQPRYLWATNSSQQKQRLPVGQIADSKFAAPKKNASPAPHRVTSQSTPEPFNRPKTGSQASRTSSRGATPTSAKPEYIRPTKSSKQKQCPPVGQAADPKPPAPKKNASLAPQRAARPSAPKPFNPPKTGSQASRASSKGATPTSSKRLENKAFASTIKSVTSTEPSSTPTSVRTALRNTPTPVSDLSELQHLSYPFFSSQTLPLTPPQSPLQPTAQPAEYPSALKHGLFNANSIYQRRSRASYMTLPQSPKNSPMPKQDCIDTAAIYYSEGNVKPYKPRAGPRRMVLAASHDTQTDKDLLAALDAPTLDPIESLGWDSGTQFDEVSLSAMTDIYDIFKSRGLEYDLISAVHF